MLVFSRTAVKIYNYILMRNLVRGKYYTTVKVCHVLVLGNAVILLFRRPTFLICQRSRIRVSYQLVV